MFLTIMRRSVFWLGLGST